MRGNGEARDGGACGGSAGEGGMGVGRRSAELACVPAGPRVQATERAAAYPRPVFVAAMARNEEWERLYRARQVNAFANGAALGLLGMSGDIDRMVQVALQKWHARGNPREASFRVRRRARRP